jgi:hypothetical protein
MNYQLPVPGGRAQSVPYELIEFPFDISRIARSRLFDLELQDMEQIALWLEHEVPKRVSTAKSLLRALGAPEVSADDPRPGLLELGPWLQAWMPIVFDPYVQKSYPGEPGWHSNWITIHSDPLGTVWAGWPHQADYSQVGDAVLHTLVVDLVAVVMDCAQRHGATPHWTAEAEIDRHPFVPHFRLVVRASEHSFAPLVQVRELLLESIGPARGERHRALRSRQSEILVDCYDQALTGRAPEPFYRLFPELRGASIRTPLKRPSRSVAPASRQLVEAVEKLRGVGLYESWKYSPEDLARALQQAWEQTTARRLPRESIELWTCLLLMDRDRTWFRDVDVCNQGVGDQLYAHTLFEIEGIGGRGFGGFSDPGEDWRSQPGTVLVDVRWRRKLRHFAIPQTSDGVLHPRLIEELNELLPEDGARFFFLDVGPTVAVVVRLTSDERRELSEASGVQILDQPPPWWTLAATDGIASLPPQRSDPLRLGALTIVPFTVEQSETSTMVDDDLRGVSITDREEDGHLVFAVWVNAAEFIRGGEAEIELENRVTAALQSSSGVLGVIRADREFWEVTGDPNEAELEEAVSSAVESVLLEFAEEIADR